jgi:hypothetical protein
MLVQQHGASIPSPGKLDRELGDYFDAAIVNRAPNRTPVESDSRAPGRSFVERVRPKGPAARSPPQGGAPSVLASGSMHRALLAARAAAAKVSMRDGHARQRTRCPSPRVRSQHNPHSSNGGRSASPPASRSHWFAHVLGAEPSGAGADSGDGGACTSGDEALDGKRRPLLRSQSHGAMGRAARASKSGRISPQQLAGDATAEQIRQAMARLAPEEAGSAPSGTWAGATPDPALPAAPDVPLPSIASSLCAAGAMRRRRQRQVAPALPSDLAPSHPHAHIEVTPTPRLQAGRQLLLSCGQDAEGARPLCSAGDDDMCGTPLARAPRPLRRAAHPRS